MELKKKDSLRKKLKAVENAMRGRRPRKMQKERKREET